MKRAVILGCPGSGKSTFAAELHARTGLPLTHLDMLWWKPDGTHVTREAFDAALSRILAQDAWILDGDYSRTYEVRLRACDTVFFLDLPEADCLAGVAQRAGKARPDCPLTSVTPDLLDQVRRYRAENRPVVQALLRAYTDREIIVFHDRAEISRWLNARTTI